MDQTFPARARGNKERWSRQAPGWLISIVFHAALLLILASITWVVLRPPAPDRILSVGDGGESDVGGGAGGDTLNAGGSPGGAAQNPHDAVTAIAAPAPGADASGLTGALAEIAPPTPGTEANASADTLAAMVSSLAGTGHGMGSGSGSGVGSGALPGVSQGFGDAIGTLRGQGLDIVLVLDATDSMTPYIEQSKKRLNDIINVTTTLVPKARFGMVAFKDYGDDYGPNACRFTKISDKPEETRKFLDTIIAGGGGDIPEPIHEALAVATDRKLMGWLPGHKNVIILISDAPVHATGRQGAYLLARQFAVGQLHGTINVIDTGGTGTGDASQRRNAPVQDLKQVSVEGKGSIFLLDDEQAFYRHLIVSVFGERYRQDVETIIARTVKP